MQMLSLFGGEGERYMAGRRVTVPSIVDVLTAISINAKIVTDGISSSGRGSH